MAVDGYSGLDSTPDAIFGQNINIDVAREKIDQKISKFLGFDMEIPLDELGWNRPHQDYLQRYLNNHLVPAYLESGWDIKIEGEALVIRPLQNIAYSSTYR